MLDVVGGCLLTAAFVDIFWTLEVVVFLVGLGVPLTFRFLNSPPPVELVFPPFEDGGDLYSVNFPNSPSSLESFFWSVG